MEYASEGRIREILTDFGIDIREITIGARRFTVTVENDCPVVVCEWKNLPEGHTVNDSNVWWVQVWLSGQDTEDKDILDAMERVL